MSSHVLLRPTCSRPTRWSARGEHPRTLLGKVEPAVHVEDLTGRVSEDLRVCEGTSHRGNFLGLSDAAQAPFGTKPAVSRGKAPDKRLDEEGPGVPIGDYCERPAATVSGSETVRAAAQRMKQEGLGTLAVVADGRPVGIVTDRDLVLETLGKQLDPGAVRVEEIALRSLVTIDQDAPVREASRMIRRHAVRRLLVVVDKGQLVGIVAVDDLLSLAAAELGGLAVAVRAQSPSPDSSRRES